MAKSIEPTPNGGADGDANKSSAPASTISGGGVAVAAGPAVSAPEARGRSFHGAAEVPAATAKMRLVQIADEIVSVLLQDPNASIRVVIEISGEFPAGAQDSVRRAVSENAKVLGLKAADWE